MCALGYGDHSSLGQWARRHRGWIRVDGALFVDDRHVVIFKHPARQSAIRRYQNGEQVTVLEALYAESRL